MTFRKKIIIGFFFVLWLLMMTLGMCMHAHAQPLLRFTYYGVWWDNPGLGWIPFKDYDYVINFSLTLSTSDALLFHEDIHNRPNEFQELPDSCHAHGIKALLSCGPDDGTYASILKFGDAQMRTLVHNLSVYAQAHHYDGIELDLEGSSAAASQAQYDAWYKALRDTLNMWPTKGYLVCSTTRWWQVGQLPVANVANMNACFDYIMMMDYDMNLSSPAESGDALYWPPCVGNVTRENTASGTQQYIAAGFQRNKLVGLIPFYFRTYNGMAKPPMPCQPWTSRDNYDWYDGVVKNILPGATRIWEDSTKSVFYSTGNSLLTGPDTNTIRYRVNYARSQGEIGVGSYGVAEGHIWAPVPSNHTADEFSDALSNDALNAITPPSPPFTVSILPSAAFDTVGQQMSFLANSSVPVDSIMWTRGAVGLYPVVVTKPPSYTSFWTPKLSGVYTISIQAFAGNQVRTAFVNITVYDSLVHVSLPPPITCDSIGFFNRGVASVNKDSIFKAGVAAGYLQANQDSVFNAGYQKALSYVPDSLTVPTQTIIVPPFKVRQIKP